MKEKEYTRVTDVLYPFSGLTHIDSHILKNAADRGTKIHEICDAIINEIGTVQLNPDFSGYIVSFKKWAEHKEFLEKPARFYCDKYMLTGECDGIYKNSSGITLFDIKTSAKEGKTWKLQGSAYAYLARLKGININEIVFVKLDKKGAKPEVFVYEEDFETYKKCMDLYRYFFTGSQPSYLDYL